MDYLELPFNKKLALLREHSFGCEWPNLEQEQWCLHCRKKFSGHAARVWADGKGRLWLECGTPGCDGSPIDWAPFPWWDPTYSAPRKSQKIREPKAGIPEGRVHRSVAKRTRVTTMMCRFEVHVSICCYNYFVGAVAAKSLIGIADGRIIS